MGEEAGLKKESKGSYTIDTQLSCCTDLAFALGVIGTLVASHGHCLGGHCPACSNILQYQP